LKLYNPKKGGKRKVILKLTPMYDKFLLAFLQAARGYTDLELSLKLGRELNRSAPYRVSLVRLGMVENSGRCRKVKTGRKATVWQLTKLGRKTAIQLEGRTHAAI
jgi:hypothetical protein